MFNFSHAARVTPNRVCCNALLAAYARAKPPQYQRVSHAGLGCSELGLTDFCVWCPSSPNLAPPVANNGFSQLCPHLPARLPFERRRCTC